MIRPSLIQNKPLKMWPLPYDTEDYYSSQMYRIKRQCEGGCVLVRMMAMPNGLLSFRVIRGNLNTEGYIHLLSESSVPLIKLNCGVSWWLQEDNPAVHKSKKVRIRGKICNFCIGVAGKKTRSEILLKTAGKQNRIWFTMETNSDV